MFFSKNTAYSDHLLSIILFFAFFNNTTFGNMLSSKNKIITPSTLIKKKARKFTPIDLAWQRSFADYHHRTLKEEEERNKIIADVKKRKDEMTQLRKLFKEMDDEVTSMVKELKDNENNYGKLSASVEKSTMRWLRCIWKKKNKKEGKTTS